MTSSRRPSLFAEMAMRFVELKEPLATASLGHILEASPVCRDALQRFMVDRGIVLPDGLRYATEVIDANEAGRPDIIGSTAAGRHLIIEGKFWATLTDSQPVGYLRSLVEGGCLALITPEQRFPTVAAELVRRCVDARLTVQDAQGAIEARFTRVEERWWMGVISWRALLGQIHAALLDVGDVRLAADVDQLDSLAELADTDAFLPLASADLSHPTPRRVYQYMQLVEAVIQHGSATGRFHTRGLRRGGSMGQYLRYAGAGTIVLALMVDLVKWSDLRHTPLWLKVWVDPQGMLDELEHDQPPRVLLSTYDRNPLFPLTLPLHVEHAAVVESVYGQIVEILDLIRDCPRTATTTDPDAEGLKAAVGETSEADDVAYE